LASANKYYFSTKDSGYSNFANFLFNNKHILNNMLNPIPENYTGPYADETYIINKNKDLNQLFLPYTSSDPKAPLTNYHTLNFKDLNEVCKKL